MNVTIFRLSTALLFAAVGVSAHAEYRCAPAPTSIDQRACEAAEQGPDSLRRFVQRWDSKMSNLYFADYVDVKTAQTWDANSSELAKRPATEDLVKVASSEKR
jgi:hypothetical protein